LQLRLQRTYTFPLATLLEAQGERVRDRHAAQVAGRWGDRTGPLGNRKSITEMPRLKVNVAAFVNGGNR